MQASTEMQETRADCTQAAQADLRRLADVASDTSIPFARRQQLVDEIDPNRELIKPAIAMLKADLDERIRHRDELRDQSRAHKAQHEPERNASPQP